MNDDILLGIMLGVVGMLLMVMIVTGITALVNTYDIVKTVTP